jgi:xanthine/CO dehydrogenase XdhC/CoxF family maturation factor
MTELQSILSALDAPSVLATVVNVEGSAYRRPGARMLVRRDGFTIGTISGGCLEADVIERAWELTASGQPALIRYDTRPEDTQEDLLQDWGFGLGCNGAVDVLLERIDPIDRPAYLRSVADAMDRRQTVIVATVFSRSGDAPVTVGTRLVLDNETDPSTVQPLFAAARHAMAEGQSQVVTVNFPHGSARVFCEKVSPPPHLLILGAGHDALPLARLAAQTGWEISVCDRRSAMATRQRFPEAMGVYAVPAEQSLAVLSHPPDAAVIMTHRYPEDVKLLRLLMDSSIEYIGVLGPRHRTDRMLWAAEVELTAEVNQRVHAPIGLDLGAETPEEIALAILAEATAVLRGYGGGKLRDKGGAIHEASSTFKIKSSKLKIQNDGRKHVRSTESVADSEF